MSVMKTHTTAANSTKSSCENNEYGFNFIYLFIYFAHLGLLGFQEVFV